jgi:hypothetical protein
MMSTKPLLSNRCAYRAVPKQWPLLLASQFQLSVDIVTISFSSNFWILIPYLTLLTINAPQVLSHQYSFIFFAWYAILCWVTLAGSHNLVLS